MNLPGIIVISVLIILIGSLLLFYFLVPMKSRTRYEPTYLKEAFATREKQKGIAAGGSIFWILLLFLTVVILMGM